MKFSQEQDSPSWYKGIDKELTDGVFYSSSNKDFELKKYLNDIENKYRENLFQVLQDRKRPDTPLTTADLNLAQQRAFQSIQKPLLKLKHDAFRSSSSHGKAYRDSVQRLNTGVLYQLKLGSSNTKIAGKETGGQGIHSYHFGEVGGKTSVIRDSLDQYMNKHAKTCLLYTSPSPRD